MKIITGKTATEHVNSEDDRGLYAGILGTGSYVLDVGSKFKATIESSNTIRIDSGDLVHNGCHARIPHDEYDEVTIDSCSAGCQRIDLIVARYRKQAGLESVELEVIKGAEAVSDPVQPDYETESILEGAEISDMPLYRVNLSNPGTSTSVTITSLFSIISTMNDRYNKSEIDTKISALTTAVETAQSTANTGVSKADAAQSTADTAVSKANAAQSTADNASSSSTSAVDYISSLRTASSNIGSIMGVERQKILSTNDLNQL